MDAKPNREYRDSLFRTYFTENPQYLLELYNAVLGSDLPPDSVVEVNTLENVLYHGPTNDLSFTIDDDVVVMIEAQSTVNENMPLRLLLYVARVYEKMLPSRDIYKRTRRMIPRPAFMVFYNGEGDMPDTQELELSASFKGGRTAGVLELTVTVYNITPGHNEDILGRCKPLREYSAVIAKINECKKSGMGLAEAIDAGVKYAIDNDIMSGFIEKHASEVRNMLFAEYDPEIAREVAKEEGFEEGMEKGLADGLEKGMEKGLADGRAEERKVLLADIVRRMKRNGWDTDVIAANTGMSAEQIERI